MKQDKSNLTRRELLSRGAAVGAAFVVGTGFVAGPNAAWAMEVEHLKPETMATLIQMARDIYPHDHVADEFYAAAVKGYDTADAAPGVESGIAALNAAAIGKGHASYVGHGMGTRPRRHPAQHGKQRVLSAGARRSCDRSL